MRSQSLVSKFQCNSRLWPRHLLRYHAGGSSKIRYNFDVVAEDCYEPDSAMIHTLPPAPGSERTGLSQPFQG